MTTMHSHNNSTLMKIVVIGLVATQRHLTFRLIPTDFQLQK